MKRKISTLMLFLLVPFALLFVGCSHWAHKSPEARAEWMVEEITEKLEINTVQLEKLNVLKNELLTIYKQMNERHEAAKNDIDSLLASNTLDQTKMLAIVNSHTKSVQTDAPKVIAAMAGFYDSLSPEQQQKIREKIKKFRERHQRWGHH